MFLENARRRAAGAWWLPLLLVAALMSSLPIPPFERSATAQTALPPAPAGWPTALQIGSADGPGGAAALRGSAPYDFRYLYLAGGVNTGNGWANWNANGQFATFYIQDSVQNGITPVFTYYMILHSSPGGSSESNAVATNLQSTSTMAAYYNDLKLFFQRAGAFPSNRVVLHVEPDMWGYVQVRTTNDNASSFAVHVSSTGLPELAGLPNNAAGLAQAIIRLRDAYARNVVVGYHVSIWGTGTDIQLSKPNDAQVDTLATRAANFYRSLGANFDLIFGEFSDRDAAFKQYVYGDGGASWFSAADFQRHARFMSTVSRVAQKRLVMWQIPLGNTRMRAENNTWNHYQDNRVEWLLDEPARTHLQTYINAGVVAFLFGRGADGPTCACDANGDGVTNPAPINGNNGVSLNADDDGGFFRQKVKDYYTAGPISLGAVLPPPTATPTLTPAPVTATPVSTAQGFATSATASPSAVARGASAVITAAVKSAAASNVLVDLELYDGAGAKIAQQAWDAQVFSSAQQRTYSMSWSAPTNAGLGTYSIRIGIFSPGWGTLYHWNDAAGSLNVTLPPTPTITPVQPALPGFATSASVSPASVARGSAITINAAITSQTATAALIDVEVYNASGDKVAQRAWDNQGFTAGQLRSYSFAWTPPSTAATGTYAVKIGVFGPGWSPLHHWNNSASGFTVT